MRIPSTTQSIREFQHLARYTPRRQLLRTGFPMHLRHFRGVIRLLEGGKGKERLQDRGHVTRVAEVLQARETRSEDGLEGLSAVVSEGEVEFKVLLDLLE
jgi:hypothetical protein